MFSDDTRKLELQPFNSHIIKTIELDDLLLEKNPQIMPDNGVVNPPLKTIQICVTENGQKVNYSFGSGSSCKTN